LKGVLAEIGYADALLVREVNGHLELIDGHCRAEETPDQEVPVLVLDVDEAEAKKLLVTLDPLASLAEASQDALGRLLHDTATDNEAVQAMLDGLAEECGIFAAAETELPDLPSGDREPFQQMTFTLSDEQASDVQRALAAAKEAGPFVNTENENSNGNALARIVEAYLGTG
jgi:ParB-like chromosome segregation protein Spo0J